MMEKGWGRSTLFLITFIFVCVHAHMYVHVCVWRPEGDIRCLRQSLSYSLDPRLSNSADLTMLPQRSWLHLQSQGLSHLPAFMWVLRIQTWNCRISQKLNHLPSLLNLVYCHYQLSSGWCRVSTQSAIAPGHVHFITFLRTNISMCWKPSLLRYCLLLTSCRR